MPGETRTIRIFGPHFDHGPVDGVGAAILNVTAHSATGNGFIIVHPNQTAAPGASTVNYSAGETESNMTIVRMNSAPGQFAAQHIRVTNHTTATVDINIDLVGWTRD